MLSIFYGRRIPTCFFSFVGGKKIKIKICLLAVVGKFELFSGNFDDILIEILPILYKNLQTFKNVGGKNKKKLGCQLFFLIGNIFCSSEDSSTIEYTEGGPTLGLASLGKHQESLEINNSPAAHGGRPLSMGTVHT